MNSIPDRDWKVFRNLHGIAVERFCERLLERVASTATDSKRNPSERLSAISKLIREGNHDLNVLADHRRSTAFFIIARLHHDQLLTPEEFEQFSPETRNLILSIIRIGEGG